MHIASGMILLLMQPMIAIFSIDRYNQPLMKDDWFCMMQVGEALFPLHTIDLNNAKVLIWPEQAEEAKGKNVIIGEERPKNVNDKILAREVVLEKTPDGKETLKITLKASRSGGAS